MFPTEYMDNMHQALSHGAISRFSWRSLVVLHQQAKRRREETNLPVIVLPPPHPGRHLRLAN